MVTRFDKALEEAARGNLLDEDRLLLERRAQKVRRLEELIRAKEATGDRIVIGIGAALVVSAMALPVYAAFLREGYVSLPAGGGSLAIRSGLASERLQSDLPSEASAPEMKSAYMHSAKVSEGPALRYRESGATPLARYVIHRATAASALIEGPNGLWWVKPGMKVPGAGRILSIEHSDGGWAVVTSETTITEEAGRYATN
jgi:hypothetical protein